MGELVLVLIGHLGTSRCSGSDIGGANHTRNETAPHRTCGSEFIRELLGARLGAPG
ncbi:hypothetical protein SF06_26190 [Pseudomonas flexibilis]|nr:hypothetical protein SF06_26190 [Pseudomonas flexibilis]